MPEGAAEAVRRERSRKEQVGRVVSAKMDKTITVLVERRVQHPLYRKFIWKRSKFYAHDERREAKEGDLVRIRETRPLSRLKRWRLVEILERGSSA
ncbi:MAG: 30S ribosomal protein S17 [Candidatus Acetothermia bacterium]|nr:30S ribosomal protein S17 [Candidatus Acetothermia bacterium]MDH7505544.1 30S ribosomal protein S17 [Candidatus Acetothermia bacterium]